MATILLPSSSSRGELLQQPFHLGMAGISIADVAKSYLEQYGDMGIVQAVKDLFACAPTSHQPQRPQNSDMLGDRRLGDAGQLGQITGAQALVQQAVDDFGACRVA
jgi:hypothetical protein